MELSKHAKTLIHLARSGDRSAFDDLVKACTRTLRAHIQALAGKHILQKYDAEDLLQETFLRAFQSMGKFKGQSAKELTCWLKTIAEHVVLDHARKLKAAKNAPERELSLERKLRSPGGDSWSIEEALAASGITASRAMRQEERFDRLKKALETLQPDHARVIRLARVQGLPIKEVARLMDRTPEATSMLLLRALLKLKAAFGGTESLHLPARSLEKEGKQDAN